MPNELDGQEHQAAPSCRVRVELDDFQNAVAGDRYNCALVWAIRRRFPEALRVSVNTERVAFSVGETRYVYPSTEQIVDKVIRPLDQGGEIEPVVVQLANGITKPVIHAEHDESIKQRDGYRTRKVRRSKGEMPLPQSSSYKRLMVVNVNE